MTKRMLIDASHPEETRVAILDGNRLEAFDFESATKKQLKGNIYLARVTRVEPSLQACFVEYGGNRQGFLAFSEIHPDYYQIPIADREALLREDEEAEAEAEADAEPIPQEGASTETASAEETTSEEVASAAEESIGDAGETVPTEGETPSETVEATSSEQPAVETGGRSPEVETVGGDEAEEARQFRKMKFYRRYKIQEVIKRRQILLVQVVKEERGMKGAALTSYISLPGRYCVLMPNSARSGVSRKISNYQDRKRMKSLITSLNVPDGMAVILRTAGADRPKTDIKRDCDYLLKLWDEIRETTLQSTAPSMIYEEGNLVKRAIRDLYGKEIEEIYIEGDEGYKAAKNLMKVLTPSHAKRVQQFKDESTSLFQKYQVESQIDSVHDNRVDLPAGGYIIINQTEALVAVDVNSGRSTRERNIEETALRTNLEAAEEIARQMRLRDLSGLIVIDFIDMENHRNKVAVERQFKEFVRKDRARMQIGRISHFGLLELTRQRLRPSVLEGSSSKCPTCNGLGVVRSVESSSLSILRAIEDDMSRRKSREIKVFMASHAAIYLLNHKRAVLTELETKHNTKILLQFDDTLVPPAHRIDRIKADRDDEEGDNRPHRQHEHRHSPVETEDTVEEDVNEDTAEDQETENTGDHESENGENNNRRNDGNRHRHHHRNREGGEQRDGEQRGPGDKGERFGRRRRGGRGRDRYRNRNRNRFNRDENGGQNNGGGNESYNGNNQSSFERTDIAAAEARHESPDFEDTPPRDFEAPRHTHMDREPARETASAELHPESREESREESRQDDNVAMVSESPSNPKRGWWRKANS